MIEEKNSVTAKSSIFHTGGGGGAKDFADMSATKRFYYDFTNFYV